MGRDQNTFEKLQREMKKKRKTQEKRAKRQRKKEMAKDVTNIDHDTADFTVIQRKGD